MRTSGKMSCVFLKSKVATVGYDEDFYKAYDDYLSEESVRQKHDIILDMWHTLSWPNSSYVIDLGCGRSQEFLRFGREARRYQGYDINLEPKADYRDPRFVELVGDLDWKPDAFVSLFSAECTATPNQNKELYECLFRELPTLQHALVSGFYYVSRRDENPVREAGDVVSWQTVGRVDEAASDVYDEMRVTTPVPSAMFGRDVVEVWRMLVRR